MESFGSAPSESIHDLINYSDSLEYLHHDVNIDSNNIDNLHDITNDALESILMEQECNSEKNEISASTSSQNNLIYTAPQVNFNVSKSKMVLNPQPIKVVAQRTVSTPLVTKFVVRKQSTANALQTSKPTILPASKNQNAISGLPTVTLANHLSLSPIKGGFKIPMSPLKNASLKVCMLPTSSSSNSVRMININKSVPTNTPQLPVQFNSNFRFQTLLPNNKVNIGNNHRFPQTANVPNQMQVSSQKLQYVRLVPTSNQSNALTSGLTEQKISTRGAISLRTAIVQTKSFANVQSTQTPVNSMSNETRSLPRLIMPANFLGSSSISPGTTLQAGNVGYAMIPAKYVEQLKKRLNQTSDGKIATSITPTEVIVPVQTNIKTSVNSKVRKPCNCTKSMCLKLYCECFANGHFCVGCNCDNCHNNVEFDVVRAKAIRACLDRNPKAFRPKIGRGCDDNRTHQKGCNCKRSGCLKNYCECYEARISCTSKCRCVDCKNLEDDDVINDEQHSLMNLADAAAVRCQQQAAAQSRLKLHVKEIRPERPKLRNSQPTVNERLPCTLFTQELIEATCTCMLAQAEEAEKSNCSVSAAEFMILEEFGRCLMQIIQTAGKAKFNSHTET